MLCFYNIRAILAFLSRNRFGDDFGVRWGRFGHQFGPNLHSKSGKSDPETTSETTWKFDTFFIDLGTILVSKKDETFMAETLLFRTKLGPRPHLGDLGPILAFQYRFWTHVGRLGTPLGRFRGRFWCHFRVPWALWGQHFQHKFRLTNHTPTVTSHEIGTVAESARLRYWIYIGACVLLYHGLSHAFELLVLF